MRIQFIFLSLFITVSCSGDSKERKYSGSTPADAVVRDFLGIPLSDSVDFIRWYLDINENTYSISCNYGIGKPNTNGFIGGGKKAELQGTAKKTDNKYLLLNAGRQLQLLELNGNLLHILNTDNTLLIGNGGWSYTLNNLSPAASDNLSLHSKQIVIKDSIAFEGRTPCAVPGIIPVGKSCYKLKWWIVLHAGRENNKGHYYLNGTGWYEQGGQRGNWEMITRRDGKIFFKLYLEDKPAIHLLKLDEGVVIFTDEQGNLLVGDHDFSYTLNRTERKF
jgi:hypothetical protein